MAKLELLCKNGQTVSLDVDGMHPKIAARRFARLVEKNGGPYVEPVADREFGRRAARGLFPELAQPGTQVDYATFVPATMRAAREFDRSAGMSPLVPLYWLIEKGRQQRLAQARKRAG